MESCKPGSRRSLLGLPIAAVVVAGIALYVSRRLRGRSLFTKPGGQAANEPEDAAVDAAAMDTVTPDDPAVESPPESAVESDSPAVERPLEPAGTAPLRDIEGIGAVYVQQLENLGLRTFNDLLTAGAGPKDREELAAAVGVGGKLLLRWVNQVDLCRVDGVGPQYADLLEAAGVDTVPELAQRRADNLAKRMAEVNEKQHLVRRLPAESEVARWIESARDLPRIVTY